ncbi:MAG: PAS domain S-box protein [Methanoregula sp.]
MTAAAIRVLYVDDEPALLEIGKQFLERSGDFSLEIIVSAPAAIELLKSEKFDAIVSDYQMPDMDGIEFLKYVRKHHSHIPFILFTGKGREEVVIQALDNGADFYLQKGGDPKSQFAELRNKIAKAVKEKQAVGAQQDSERRLADIINFLPDATLAIDVNGTVIAWNRAMEQMTGVNADSIIGKGDYEYALPFYHERRPILLDLILNFDKNIADKYDTIKRDGANLISEKFIPFLYGGKGAYLWFVASPFFDAGGNCVGAIESIRDITDQKKMEGSLRASEQRYHNIFESAAEAMIVVDRDSTKILDANLAAMWLYKYTRDEFKTLQFSDLTADKKPNVKIDKEGILYIPERQHRKKDGSLFPAEISGNVYPQKKRTIAIISVRDITDRKKADEEAKTIYDELAASYEQLTATEQQLRQTMGQLNQQEQDLRESEEKYRTIFENAGDAIAIHDLEGNFIEVNDIICKRFGYSREELLKIKVSEVDDPENARYVGARIEDLTNKGHIIFETVHIARDGRKIPAEVNATLFHIGNKPVVMSIARDITERKKYDEALLESERRYRLLTECMKDVVWQMDAGMTFTYISPSVLQQCGYTPEEIVGKRLFEFITPESAQNVRRQMAKRIEQDKGGFYRGSATYLLEQVCRDGSTLVTEVVTNPVFDEKENFIGWRGITRDISERKQVEEALRLANKKLKLLSGITRHDISNQVTGLQNYLALVELKPADPSYKKYLLAAETAAQRISTMIRFTDEYELIGVDAPVWQDCRTLVDTASKEAPLNKVIVKNDLPGGMEVFADPLIVRVFYNLMDNAARYGGKITTISFSVQERDGNQIILCEDDGNGVPAEQKEKIFERGYGKNTGLGLTLSREILDITGITIIESGEPGKGARFEIAIPGGQFRSVS